MGFRFRKSIGLGKFGRINIGRKGISSVTLGRRGGPHVTVGKDGTSVGTSIPGTGISYEKRIGRHSGGKSGAGNDQSAEATQVMPAVAQPAPPDPATRVVAPVVPPVAGSQPPSGTDGGSGNRNGGRHGGSGNANKLKKTKKPWYKRWWVWMLTVLFVVGGASYALEPSAEVPNVVGMNATEARTALSAKGFTKISFDPLAAGDDSLWIVRGQTPADGKHKTSESVELTIKKNLSGIPDVVQAGMTLTAAESALTESGYTADDYTIASDDGKTVTDASRYTVVSVTAGDPPTIRVHDSKADEEATAAQKTAEEAEAAAQKAAEEEAAKKAAEEEAAKQKATEEEAAQNKAEEEAAKKAAQEQEQKQQSSATPKPTPTPQKTTSSGSGSGGSDSGSGSGSSSGGSSTSDSGVLVAICKDGTQSTSSPGAKDYRGMCSSHGGIAQKLGRR